MGLCTRCAQLKESTAFAKMAQARDGLRPNCKACDAIARVVSFDQRKAYSRQYYAANRERAAELNADWMRRNRVSQAQKKAAYQREHMHEYRARNATREAAKKQAVPLWADVSKIRDFYMLADLVTEETGVVHEVDHVVPLQSSLVCGLHWHGNLQVLPAAVNRSKSNRVWPDMPDQARA